MTTRLDSIIQSIAATARSRTRYPGQAPSEPEVLVEALAHARDLLSHVRSLALDAIHESRDAACAIRAIVAMTEEVA